MSAKLTECVAGRKFMREFIPGLRSNFAEIAQRSGTGEHDKASSEDEFS